MILAFLITYLANAQTKPPKCWIKGYGAPLDGTYTAVKTKNDAVAFQQEDGTNKFYLGTEDSDYRYWILARSWNAVDWNDDADDVGYYDSDDFEVDAVNYVKVFKRGNVALGPVSAVKNGQSVNARIRCRTDGQLYNLLSDSCNVVDCSSDWVHLNANEVCTNAQFGKRTGWSHRTCVKLCDLSTGCKSKAEKYCAKRCTPACKCHPDYDDGDDFRRLSNSTALV